MSEITGDRTSNTISPTLVERVKQHFQRRGCAGLFPLGLEVIEALEQEAQSRFALAKARSWLREYVRRHEEEWGADVAERPADLIEAMGEPVAFAENPIVCKHAKARITCTDCGIDLQPAKLSGKPSSPAETAAKPTDSELYGSSELFRHVWVCPMGWIGDKLIYGPGYTLADMKPWLVKLRRLVGFEHPEGTPLEQPENGKGIQS